MTRVVIVQEALPHYRVPLFQKLRTALGEHGVTLDVVVGQPLGVAATRRDQSTLSWATVVHSRRVGPLVWQPALKHVKNADLVIVEQANRNALGHVLRVGALLGGSPVALWGHGANLQREPGDLRERLKKTTTGGAAWFFAYTEGSAARARSCGVPPHKITVVQNAVETVAPFPVPKIAGRCVYVGGLYSAKRLAFLLEASDHLKRAVPGFGLHVIGDGPERELIQRSNRPHVQYHGVLTGRARDELLHSSQLTLMPGLVGLVVLDSFAASAPLVTVAAATHSPEMEYAISGVNALVLEEGTDPRGYAQAVTDLLEDPMRLAALRRGCLDATMTYTLDEMVHRFTEGVLEAVRSLGHNNTGSAPCTSP